MKHILAIAIGTFAISGYALDKLPNGTWEGKGTFFGQKAEEKGVYEEKLTIKDNTMTSELKMGDEKAVYVTRVEFRPNDFAYFTIEDKVKGTVMKATGYCTALACHVETDDNRFEMTIGFHGDHAYEFGSGTEDKALHRFEGMLKKVAN